jgi:hypothetical protein
MNPNVFDPALFEGSAYLVTPGGRCRPVYVEGVATAGIRALAVNGMGWAIQAHSAGRPRQAPSLEGQLALAVLSGDRAAALALADRVQERHAAGGDW